jgi:hypothetical protein
VNTEPNPESWQRAAFILQDLYDSEINFSIVAVWDSGFEVKLGDEVNGFAASGRAFVFADAVEWLRVRAIENFPQSEFARTYAGEGPPA